jgi:hypothetical protein
MYLVCTWYVPEVCTETNMVCNLYVLCMYWNYVSRQTWHVLGMYLVVVHTREKKAWHNAGNRTQYLMPTILRVIPLRYQRAFLGDMDD